MAHRLFPGLTALWFAALFGLGGLAASADALAGLVLHLHLPAILPAAAPPLGLTAHLLAALALAGLGGVCGLALGVVLYARAGGTMPQRPQRPQRAAPEPQPARTRSAKPSADAVAVSAPRVRNRDAHPDAPPRRPLVVSDDVLPYAANVFEPARPVPAAVAETPVDDMSADAFAIEQNHLASDGSAPEPEEPEHDLPPFLAAAWSATRRDDAPIFVPPAEPVIQPAEPEPVAAEVVEPETAVPEPVAVAPPASLPPLASLAAAAPQVPLHEAPLASLGLVQLIERLALAIATRQARRPVAPAVDVIDPLTPLHRFDPLTMDPPGPLLRTKPSRFAQVRAPEVDEVEAPVQHAPIAGGLHDPLAAVGDWADDDLADDLPPRFLGAAAHDNPVAGHYDGADDGIVEHRYSSLVGMALPRPELVASDFVHWVAPVAHHDEPAETGPVVPFPQRLSGGDNDASELAPNEADRALRDALATLRRMSAQR